MNCDFFSFLLFKILKRGPWYPIVQLCFLFLDSFPLYMNSRGSVQALINNLTTSYYLHINLLCKPFVLVLCCKKLVRTESENYRTSTLYFVQGPILKGERSTIKVEIKNKC